MSLRRRTPTAALTLATCCCVLLAGAAPASARDDEARVSGRCDGGGRSELRLRADDGAIRVRFEVEGRRTGTWRVVLVQDRRVVWRGRAQLRGSGKIRVERRLRDLSGADRVSARAWGPGGVTCSAAATLGE